MEEYQKTFSRNFNLKKLRKNIQMGKYTDTKIRTILWRVCLGCFSEDPNPDNFLNLTLEHRKRYTILIKSYFCCFEKFLWEQKKIEKQKQALKSNSQKPSGNETFLKNKKIDEELFRVIQLDIDRTNPDNEFYSKPKIKKKMFNILFIYSKEHPDLSYRQGMHEILAPIIYVVYQEYQKRNGSSTFMHLIDEKYIEEDSYLIFERIMYISKNLFLTTPSSTQSMHKIKDHSSNNNNNKNNNNNNNNNNNKDKNKNNESETNNNLNNLFLKKVLNYTKNINKQKTKNNIFIEENTKGILTLCQQVQDLYLKKYDEKLYRYFISLELVPQLYSLRWYRLLLSREFALKELILIWDYIFSDYSPIECIGYIIVVMLIMIRDNLLNQDETIVLQQLFKYKLNSDIQDLLKTTRTIRNQKPKNLEFLNNFKSKKFRNNKEKNLIKKNNDNFLQEKQKVKKNEEKQTKKYFKENKVTALVSVLVDREENDNEEEKISEKNKNILTNFIIVPKLFVEKTENKKTVSKLELKKAQIKKFKKKIKKREQFQYRLGLELEKSIKSIQEILFSKPKKSNDIELKDREKIFYLSISELKQVKDVLFKRLLFEDLEEKQNLFEKKRENNNTNKKKNVQENENGNWVLNLNLNGNGNGGVKGNVKGKENVDGRGDKKEKEKEKENGNGNEKEREKEKESEKESNQSYNDNNIVEDDNNIIIFNDGDGEDDVNINYTINDNEENKIINLKNNLKKKETSIFQTKDEVLDIFSKRKSQENKRFLYNSVSSPFVVSKFGNYLQNNKKGVK
ncbi:tbc1 domain family member gtpase-activating protein [Anaeramoeba flamelloides]|uniref:Tbc1 domain family member gtpase-activating protein n=1 Tax=Anaeramoeba flamelloides TaxID=1746091 RepID=A0AAV7YHA2_9EUKA|nr:tbc1 domain family member gtpase-activating protein [Anaeramoeba flamelloides]